MRRNHKSVGAPEFPKIVKAVSFFEYSSDPYADHALDDVERFVRGYLGSGERIYDRFDVIDRNGTRVFGRELTRIDPPVILVVTSCRRPMRQIVRLSDRKLIHRTCSCDGPKEPVRQAGHRSATIYWNRSAQIRPARFNVLTVA